MPISYLRFCDLKARNIAHSWARVHQLIEQEGFPPGRLLSPQVRVWTEEEIEKFHASRPIASAQPPRGGAKRQVERSRIRAAESATT